MEGSSATSPLGEPTVPIIANCVPSLSAAESVNSAQNQVCSDATSFGEINSPMLLIDDSSTPKKKQSFSQEGSLYKPQCHEELKPKVGMIFDDIGSVLEFYRTYAHNVGFGVRLGQQKVINNVLQWKRFLCAKEGFRPEKVPCSTQEHEESFIGSIIPKDVTILTPIDINARGTCSRIKGHRDGVRGGSGDKKRRLGIHQKVARKCSICKKVAFHDARTCSMKNMTQE